MNEERNFPLATQPEKTKKFQFGMVWTVSGQQTIDVPKSLSAKEALEHPFFRRTLENEYQNIKENDVNNKNVLNMLDMERD